MILRAIFWIGLVSFLVPHEPDLGFGRPSSGLAALLPSGIAALMPDGAPAPAAPSSMAALIQSTGAAEAPDACAAHKAACAGGLSILDGFQSMAIRSMDEVRADLAAHRTPLR